MVSKSSRTQGDGSAPRDWTDAEAALSKLARVSADQGAPAPGSDFSAGPRIGEPALDAARRPAEPSHPLATDRPSLRKRATRSLARFLVPACLGVAATLGWQSYGGMAKPGISGERQPVFPPSQPAMSLPSARSINFEEPGQGEAPATVPSAASGQAGATGATSPDRAGAGSTELQQLETILRDLGALRQSVEQLAAGQEQIARDIAKLQTAAPDLRRRIPTPPPAPPAPVARKPAPPAPQASAALPPPAPISPPPSAAPPPPAQSASDAPPRPPLPLR
jgi:hypothetical protein